MMDAWMFVSAVLVILLIGQQAFYSWQMHQLLNKLMSRNYAEFKLVSDPPQAAPAEIRFDAPDPGQMEDLRILNDMLPKF